MLHDLVFQTYLSYNATFLRLLPTLPSAMLSALPLAVKEFLFVFPHKREEAGGFRSRPVYEKKMFAVSRLLCLYDSEES